MKISMDWLAERVEDAPTDFGASRSPTLALRHRGAWQRLKSRAQEGDEVWSFVTPESRRRGQPSGYVLIRDGQILDSAVVPSE